MLSTGVVRLCLSGEIAAVDPALLVACRVRHLNPSALAVEDGKLGALGDHADHGRRRRRPIAQVGVDGRLDRAQPTLDLFAWLDSVGIIGRGGRRLRRRRLLLRSGFIAGCSGGSRCHGRRRGRCRRYLEQGLSRGDDRVVGADECDAKLELAMGVGGQNEIQIADLIRLQAPFAVPIGAPLGETAALRQTLYGDDAARRHAVGAIDGDGKAHILAGDGCDPVRRREHGRRNSPSAPARREP